MGRLLPLAVALALPCFVNACAEAPEATSDSNVNDVAAAELPGRGSQAFDIEFKCKAIEDYSGLDQLVTKVYRYQELGNKLRFGVENFLMICADKVSALATFDQPSKTLAIDVEPTGLKHCLCEYTFSPFAVGVPSGIGRAVENYTLKLGKTESGTPTTMYTKRIGDIPMKSQPTDPTQR